MRQWKWREGARRRWNKIHSRVVARIVRGCDVVVCLWRHSNAPIDRSGAARAPSAGRDVRRLRRHRHDRVTLAAVDQNTAVGHCAKFAVSSACFFIEPHTRKWYLPRWRAHETSWVLLSLIRQCRQSATGLIKPDVIHEPVCLTLVAVNVFAHIITYYNQFFISMKPINHNLLLYTKNNQKYTILCPKNG